MPIQFYEITEPHTRSTAILSTLYRTMDTPYLAPHERPATGLYTPSGQKNTRYAPTNNMKKIMNSEKARASQYAQNVNARRSLRGATNQQLKRGARNSFNMNFLKEQRNRSQKNAFHAMKENAGRVPGALYMPSAYGQNVKRNERHLNSTATSKLHPLKGGRRSRRHRRTTRK